MDDITMCKGTNCSKAKSCYRFTANINEFMQSYFMEIPFDKGTNKCEYYWKRKENE